MSWTETLKIDDTRHAIPTLPFFFHSNNTIQFSSGSLMPLLLLAAKVLLRLTSAWHSCGVCSWCCRCYCCSCSGVIVGALCITEAFLLCLHALELATAVAVGDATTATAATPISASPSWLLQTSVNDLERTRCHVVYLLPQLRLLLSAFSATAKSAHSLSIGSYWHSCAFKIIPPFFRLPQLSLSHSSFFLLLFALPAVTGLKNSRMRGARRTKNCNVFMTKSAAFGWALFLYPTFADLFIHPFVSYRREILFIKSLVTSEKAAGK